ncbi:MAG: hypothetical protein JW761_02670 [Prolixibacteraceae bacterium]|nr:hypothetical protein [Prolixibacteraceae bacterium]
MSLQKKHTGFAIAIAWPETWCKQSGAWYDGFINRLEISKHHYYKVGHAALVLIDDETGRCHYFDFGRYHTPFQHGRARSEKTDDGLKMKSRAKISADKKQILNYEDILTELQNNAECHGEGAIHASYGRINFEKALAKAEEMQQQSPIRYGPFRYKGSNCSRFVNTVLRAGNPDWKSAFKLNFLVPLTPTPMNNVNSFGNKTTLPKLLPLTFTPSPVADKSKLKGVLPEPKRPGNVTENAQWLAGEGAGSWFAFEIENHLLKVIRYSVNGVIECVGLFENKDAIKFLKNDKSYKVAYPSNCKTVSLHVNGSEIRFNRAN